MKKFKYNYFYKITNLINNHYYYGIHCTNDLDDGYMGSGKRLHYAYKKYGIENFSKEILKYFDSVKEAYEYEAEVVTEELVKLDECYNLKVGGLGGWDHTKNTIIVKDECGNNFRISKDDPNFLNGHYKSAFSGYFRAKDKDGNVYYINENDERYLKNELIKIPNYFSNKVLVIDNSGKCFATEKDNIDLNNLKPFWKGRKHKELTKQKIKESQKKTFKKIKHQQGSKNSSYGKKWICNIKENKSLLIKKELLDEYLNNGWVLGRNKKIYTYTCSHCGKKFETFNKKKISKKTNCIFCSRSCVGKYSIFKKHNKNK